MFLTFSYWNVLIFFRVMFVKKNFILFFHVTGKKRRIAHVV